jgi:transposase
MKTSGLDVHKDSIFCAVYEGGSYSVVKEFSTATVSIRELGSYLESEKVKKAAMESTSTCRVPIWDILYETGFELKLVNPLHINQMPGRKSDVKDAQRIAGLLHGNMLRGSPVPSPLIREFRSYSRGYRSPVNQCTKVPTQIDRIPVMCGIRLSSCISNIDSKSFMQVVETLIRGETDPESLVQMVYGNRKNKEIR